MPGLGTLGEAHSQGWRIHLRCNQGKQVGMRRIPECQWRHEADVLTLLATRGPSFPLSMLSQRLMCPRCGTREVLAVFEPPSRADAAAARRMV